MRCMNKKAPLRAQVSLLLALYMRAKRRRKAQKQDLWAMLSERLRDTARWSAFLGSFAGVFVTFDEGIAHAFGKARSATRDARRHDDINNLIALADTAMWLQDCKLACGSGRRGSRPHFAPDRVCFMAFARL